MDYKERRNTIINMRRNCPCFTLSRIAKDVGVTRERVRQILKEEKLHTKHLKLKVYCQRCGDERAKNTRSPYCKRCNFELHNVELTCTECGAKFWRRVSQILQYEHKIKVGQRNTTLAFCNNKCWGKYSGTHFGFAVHPEFATLPKASSEYTHNLIILALSQRQEGETEAALLKRFKINQATFIRYKRKYGTDYRNYPLHRLGEFRERIKTSSVIDYLDVSTLPTRDIVQIIESGAILNLPNINTIRWKIKSAAEYYKIRIAFYTLDKELYMASRRENE